MEHKGLCGLNLLHNFVSDEPMKDSKPSCSAMFTGCSNWAARMSSAAAATLTAASPARWTIPAPFASFGDYMVENGISRRVSDKIMFDNALRFFEENVR